MAKSIYDQIADGDELAKVWGGMQDGSVYQESTGNEGGKQLNENFQVAYSDGDFVTKSEMDKYKKTHRVKPIRKRGEPVIYCDMHTCFREYKDGFLAFDSKKSAWSATLNESNDSFRFNEQPSLSFNSIFNSLKAQLGEAQETYEECKDCGNCKKCDKKKGRGYKSKRGMGKLFSEDMDEVEELADVDVSPEEVEDIEDTYEEDKMVSVPVALLDELYQYTKDAMGSEDEVEIDQEEFEQLEESAKPFFQAKANGNYKKTSVNKYTNDKWRFLTKALGHYAHGSTRSAGKVGRGKLFK